MRFNIDVDYVNINAFSLSEKILDNKDYNTYIFPLVLIKSFY